MRMQSQTTDEIQRKKGVSVRTVLLVITVVLATLFAVKNWTLVTVWPLGPQKPLTLVIAISFVLGALIGWLGHSILFNRRPLGMGRGAVNEGNR